MSEKLPISVAELRLMIGLSVYYGPSLVLQANDAAIIQSNLHGHPTRRSPQTISVRVLSENGSALHKEFLELDLIE